MGYEYKYAIVLFIVVMYVCINIEFLIQFNMLTILYNLKVPKQNHGVIKKLYNGRELCHQSFLKQKLF